MRFTPRSQTNRQQIHVDMPFGNWEPDRGDVGRPLAEAKNCVPEVLGFLPLKSLSAFSTGGLTAAAVGSFWTTDDSDGTKFNFAGDATKLYVYDLGTTSWDDRSISTGYSGATRWEFARFGNRVIAVSEANNTQYIDVPLGASETFDNLPNTNPRTAASVEDYTSYADTAALLTVWTDSSPVGGSITLDAVNNELDFNPAGVGSQGYRTFQLVENEEYVITCTSASIANTLTWRVGTAPAFQDIVSQFNQTTADPTVSRTFTAPSGGLIYVTGIVNGATTNSSGSITISRLPPKARTVAIVRDFVVLGGASNQPNRVAWSGFNNSEIWNTNPAAQSDQQDLKGRTGAVQKIIGGEVGLIFTEQSVWRMEYVGPPVVFRFDEIKETHGTPAPRSVVRANNLVYYFSHDGFKVMSENGEVGNIGANRVDLYFRERVVASRIDSIEAVVDRINGLVIWAWSEVATTYNDRLLIYNYKADRWSWGEVDTQILGEYAPEDVETSIGVLAFDTSNQSGTFSGSALQAVLETGLWHYGGVNGRFRVRDVETVVEGGGTATITLQVASDEDIDQASLTFGSAIGRDVNGQHHVDIEGHYFQFRVNITGGFEEAYMLRINGYQSGRL